MKDNSKISTIQYLVGLIVLPASLLALALVSAWLSGSATNEGYLGGLE